MFKYEKMSKHKMWILKCSKKWKVKTKEIVESKETKETIHEHNKKYLKIDGNMKEKEPKHKTKNQRIKGRPIYVCAQCVPLTSHNRIFRNCQGDATIVTDE
jgi:hypothetical protein